MHKSEKNIPKVIVSHKQVGETPLEVIEMLRKESEDLKSTPITYAGRLDPMAEGVLLLLVGEEVHEKEKYLELDKEYEFEVLFGFATDSYDLLGKITDTSEEIVDEEKVRATLLKLIGTYEQKYPPYSSKPVDGKPLFEWARAGRLHEITIPTHEIEVKKLACHGVHMLNNKTLKGEILSRLNLVNGDFRQEEIKELWDAYIENAGTSQFAVATFVIECSSGTYVRSLVHELGELLGIPTTTFSINRTKVGDYEIE